MPDAPTPGPAPLATSKLRWRCDPARLEFESTRDLEPISGVVGQDEAVDALRFGLEIHAPGQNIYVRGLEGTGRLTTVKRLLEEIRPQAPMGPDHLYVHNFDHPDRPRLLTVARGRGALFCEELGELRSFILRDLGRALTSEIVMTRRKAIEGEALAKIQALTEPLEQELAQDGLALVVREAGGVAKPLVVPLVEGKPVPPDRFAAMVESGAVPEDALERLRDRSEGARAKVDKVFRKVSELHRKLRQDLREMMQEEAISLLEEAARGLREAFSGDEVVGCWIDRLIHDVVHRRLDDLDQIEALAHLYEANPISCHAADEPSPVIVESVGTIASLVGSVDALITPEGHARADHGSVRAGSLVQADGGVLVIEAMELLSHRGAWSAVVRTLRTGRVDYVPPELPVLMPGPALKPEPIPVNVKVVLLGDARVYYALDELDHDFPHLFKVLADFDEMIPRNGAGVRLYAGVLARIAKDEGLAPFSAAAVAELAEHGARVAATRNKLTARLGRLADIAREAAFLAAKISSEQVTGEQVREAVRRTKRRGDGPARRFRELVVDGRIRVAVHGRKVGQINGLAVMKAGPLTYGFPTRITATLGTGTGGTINIEREAELSGSLHTKGFYILGGLLRHLLRSEHPLSFEASIAFEQSYGGIDGDSASAAEIVCLLSALTDTPICQNLAMTGAIDQLGNLLPIGAVNEKIEGFYDTCSARGLDGEQGVVIPEANVGDLMLRHDVVEACERGEFHVWSVARVHEAITLFFGEDAGERDTQTGFYPEGTVLHRAVISSFMLWQRAQAKPEDYEVVGTDNEEGPPN